ncbi:MAG TPA: AsmA-like C-terminal region-containing protein, partial [Burkholderiales bacterium]|nr:AsmA-like C-terminal region-containing protein [Burkholderiales bacterium]
SDIGKTLTRWRLPEGIRGGTAKVEGSLSWAGSPQEFDYPTLTGNLAIDATRGQFVKLEPGIAKLLGILSLQALPRRITLDFRDIFSEGFAFDSILGAVKINRGVASTESLHIRGPSGEVVMSGDVDLSRETQSLRVRVSPHLSESLSIAGALLGGPVAGVAAFLAQKVLKDPFDQIVGFDYRISGTWSDPQVAKLDRREARVQEPTP